MIENAIAFPLYICFLLAIFSVLRANYCRVSMQFALTDAARESSIATPAVMSSEFQNRLSNLGITWNPATDKLTVCPQTIFLNATLCPRGTIVTGVPLELMVYRSELAINLLLPGPIAKYLSITNLTIASTVISRNEPAS